MSACTGCGAVVPDGATAQGSAGARAQVTHRYLVSSPECFAAFGELLADSYAGLRYDAGDLHQTRVDAWAGQHPGPDTPAANQAVALCLMTLRLVLEDGVDAARGPALHQRMAEHGPYPHLLPPARRGDLTVLDVLAAPPGVRDAATLAWAREVWAAWATHHAQVGRWLVATGTTSDLAAAFPRGTGHRGGRRRAP